MVSHGPFLNFFIIRVHKSTLNDIINDENLHRGSYMFYLLVHKQRELPMTYFPTKCCSVFLLVVYCREMIGLPVFWLVSLHDNGSQNDPRRSGESKTF